MSLSSWFRDYLYIPLGGNRHGPWRTYFNLFTVFLLCGLWHGAAWTFLLWGVYHGVILAIERAGVSRFLGKLPKILKHIYTLLLVMVGWVIFRAESLPQLGQFLKAMFLGAPGDGASLWQYMDSENMFFMCLGLLLCLPILENSRHFKTQEAESAGPAANSVVIARDTLICALLFFVCTTYVMSGTYNPFIYFRF